MGLRIQNNITAMNAHRQLSIADSSMSKSLERLSSGYRINTAKDDAAGLAISQGFRSDIASMKVASRNMSEANSMMQVAEGAMAQLDSMLIRLKETATQSASDNVGDTEREKIHSEASKVLLEMDRIADSTKYGSSKLLDGTFGGLSSSTTDAAGTVMSSDDSTIYKYTDAGANNAVTITVGTGAISANGTWTMATGAGGIVELTNGGATVTASFSGTTLTFDEVGITLNATGVTSTLLVGDTIEVDNTGLSSSSISLTGDAAAGSYTITEASGSMTISDGTTTQSITGISDGAQTLNFSTLGIKLDLDSNFDTSATNMNGIVIAVSGSGTKTFQIGADNDTDNRLSVQISDTTTSASGLNVSSLDLSSQTGSQTALSTIDTAMSTLASRRSDIGGYQNRLSYAMANIASTIENTQAAESVIRDVDMAAEMTTFTKNQILMQAGTAMLAQANMAPQQVLSLFG